MRLLETVGNPNEVIYVKPGYEVFFKELMNLVRKNGLNQKLGEELKSLALAFPSRYNLDAFDIESGNQYERTFLGRDESGWEAIIMTWRKGRQSSIHSHPQFAAYNVLRGDLKLEIFEDAKGNGDIKLVNSLGIVENTGLFAIGESNKITNHIHRISGLSDISYSLHIYSDDARKGLTYSL
jgi:predicted metal-dependent enzyme (double-stranded beta helix superfamily)